MKLYKLNGDYYATVLNSVFFVRKQSLIPSPYLTVEFLKDKATLIASNFYFKIPAVK